MLAQVLRKISSETPSLFFLISYKSPSARAPAAAGSLHHIVEIQ